MLGSAGLGWTRIVHKWEKERHYMLRLCVKISQDEILLPDHVMPCWPVAVFISQSIAYNTCGKKSTRHAGQTFILADHKKRTPSNQWVHVHFYLVNRVNDLRHYLELMRCCLTPHSLSANKTQPSYLSQISMARTSENSDSSR